MIDLLHWTCWQKTTALKALFMLGRNAHALAIFHAKHMFAIDG